MLAGIANDVSKVSVIEVVFGVHEHEITEVAEDTVTHLQTPDHLQNVKKHLLFRSNW